MADVPKLSAFSTLASGITAGASSLTVQSGHGARFPDTATEGAFNICVYDSRYKNFDVAYRAGMGEVMRCTSRSTDTFTVTRAQEGTSAVAFNTTGVTYRVEQNMTPIYFTARDLPSQTGNGGKFLQTSGTATSWATANSVQFVYCGSIGSGATVFTIPSYGTNNATESNVEIPFWNNVTVKNLRLRVIGNAGASVTATIRKNAGDTTVTCTASGGGTGGDGTHSVSYEGNGGASDVFAIKLVSTASGYTVTAVITFEIYPS